MRINGLLLDSPTLRVSFRIEDGIMHISSPVFLDKTTQFLRGTPFNDQWRKEEDGKTYVRCSIFLKDCERRENALISVRLNVLANNLGVTGPIVWCFVYQKIEEGDAESQFDTVTTETNFSLSA